MSNQQQSYYKILGTTANIGQRRIKEKYINAVRQHPPESDPEQFEKIREAYDTLKDPVKRKQYDISRKYSGDIETMLNKAYDQTLEEDYDKANTIYHDILQIDPDNFGAQMGSMIAHLNLNQHDKAQHMLEQILASPALEEDDALRPSAIYATFCKFLIEQDYMDKAITFIEKGLDRFPDDTRDLNEALIVAYLMTEQNEKAVQAAEDNIPPIEATASIEDIGLYQTWLLTVLKTENWSHTSKVQARFRKYLKHLQDPEDREEAFSALSTEFKELYDVHEYRQAEVFLELATVAMPDDADAKAALKEVRRFARAEKDMYKLIMDQSIFPLIIYHAVHWFFNDNNHPLVQNIDDFFTPQTINEFQTETDYYAAGILKLQKTYPSLYQLFNSDWESLYKDLTKHMNREAKRELKKLI